MKIRTSSDNNKSTVKELALIFHELAGLTRAGQLKSCPGSIRFGMVSTAECPSLMTNIVMEGSWKMFSADEQWDKMQYQS